jgi:bifunctional non-homologous end joining protein LigD
MDRGEYAPARPGRLSLYRGVRRAAGRTFVLFSEALSAEGALVFAKACKLGLEGIVSKRAGRPYRSGTSHNWLKAKNPEFERT